MIHVGLKRSNVFESRNKVAREQVTSYFEQFPIVGARAAGRERGWFTGTELLAPRDLIT